MKAEIVSVGTEMLLGMIADTNAQFLSQQLAELGIDVYWISQVGDNLGRVVEIFQRGLGRSDVVVVTGGLGPTEDDLTRESIAATLGQTMEIDPHLERELREGFARRERPMPERNLKQATLIPSARALSNPIGTAPGWWVEHDGKIIVAMPGVPAEMHLMWESHVKPALRERAGAAVLVTTNLRVLGLGEGAVEEQLGDLVRGTNPTVATYAKPDGVQVRVSAKAKEADEARALITPVVEQITRIMGSWIYGTDDETLASLVGQELERRGWGLVSAERGTAGALVAEISSDPALIGCFRGGFMVTNEGSPLGKGDLRPVELAAAARNQTGAEVAIATALALEGPAVDFAVDVKGVQRAEITRWNRGIPELRRRSAVESMALLLRVLRALE